MNGKSQQIYVPLIDERPPKEYCAEKYCFYFLVFLLLFLYFFYYKTHLLITNPDAEHSLRMSAKVEWPPPLILSWNPFFGSSTAMEWLLKENDVTACPHLCRYSGDKKLERNASAIIFHIRDGFGPLPSHRTPDQLYTFFLLESPANSGGNHKNVPPDFFNISMTFRRDSDIFFPYDAFEAIPTLGAAEEEEERWTEEEVRWKVGNKSKLALQFVSNCQTNSLREKYVDKVREHMDLTQMGQCVGRHDCNAECFQGMIDQHFFYLAFENSVCRNYLSEKFWNVKRLIVPVVLSRKVLANLNVPPGAFIAADDFDSPKELADHLKMVANDTQLYTSYLQWTRKFKKSEYRKGPSNALCQLCKLAHEKPRRPRRIENIVDFWEGKGGHCEQGYAQRLLGNST